MIWIVVLVAILALIFYVGSDKATEKGHDWLVVPILVIGFIVFGIFSIKSCVHDAANRTPQYDYYDDRTPR
ncbi:MAG: hypothetical protein J6I41_08075 [Bacteroidales bacterium]|nr:hypothetical protein [Bacteroidales bacterium]